MNSCSFSQERRQKVTLDWYGFIRVHREMVGSLHRTLGVVARNSVRIFVRQSMDRLEVALFPQRLKQLNKCLLTLATDGVIHVVRVQRRGGIVRGEVSSPKNRQVWEACANFPATCHSPDGLWTGHDGDRQKLHLGSLDDRDQTLGGIWIEVPVNNRVPFFAFQ